MLYCFTVVIGLSGDASDYNEDKRSERKTRSLSIEVTMRARSEILAIWVALKQMSENQNDGNLRCFAAIYENKKFQHSTFLLSTLAPHLTELSKVFQAGCFNLAQMKLGANPASKVRRAIYFTTLL